METESLREKFLELGHTAADDPGDADLVVVNTCSVTGKADRDCVAFLRRTAAANPKAAIAVTGCLATLEPAKILAAASLSVKKTWKESAQVTVTTPVNPPPKDFGATSTC